MNSGSTGSEGRGSEQGGVGRPDSTNGAGGEYARRAITGDEGVPVAQVAMPTTGQCGEKCVEVGEMENERDRQGEKGGHGKQAPPAGYCPDGECMRGSTDERGGKAEDRGRVQGLGPGNGGARYESGDHEMAYVQKGTRKGSWSLRWLRKYGEWKQNWWNCW